MIRLLLISANPEGTEKIKVDSEFNSIASRCSSSAHRDSISIRNCLAANLDELRDAVFEHNPNIVHFSGHGTLDTLILEDADGSFSPVSSKKLFEFLSLFKKTQGVFLNACYSSGSNIDSIFGKLPFVIAVRGRVLDEDAVVFSSSFYGALFNGESVENAFSIAKSAVDVGRNSYTFSSVDRSLALPDGFQRSQFILYKSPSLLSKSNSKKFLYGIVLIFCIPLLIFLLFVIYSKL